MIIIGITGTLGAGKGTIVEYLIHHKSFNHFSVRGYLTKVIRNRGLAVNRDNMVAVANELRAANSPSYIIEELYQEAAESGRDCIIESIRTVGEVEALRKKENFYLFAVDAKPETRYQRVVVRASETDKVSFDEFMENEKREMNSGDPNRQNLSKCIEMADYKLNNNGSVEELYEQTEKIISEIKTKI